MQDPREHSRSIYYGTQNMAIKLRKILESLQHLNSTFEGNRTRLIPSETREFDEISANVSDAIDYYSEVIQDIGSQECECITCKTMKKIAEAMAR